VALGRGPLPASVELLGEGLFAQSQTVAADEHLTRRDKTADLVAALTAEAAPLAPLVRRDRYQCRASSQSGKVFLLAPYVAVEAVHKLVTGEQPETSWLGIALVTSSVIGMPFLGVAKRRLSDRLGSVALPQLLGTSIGSANAKSCEPEGPQDLTDRVSHDSSRASSAVGATWRRYRGGLALLTASAKTSSSVPRSARPTR
jgi:hypothetical protein